MAGIAIFAVEMLNFCVRDGNRWILTVINTDYGVVKNTPSKLNNETADKDRIAWSSPRPISTRWLNMSPCLHLVPIYLVVFKGSYLIVSVGYLILRPVSRLDAFSVYPIRT